MTYYRQAGSIPAVRHTQHRSPEGDLYYEELISEQGFSSATSLVYHRNIPSALVDIRSWPLSSQSTFDNHPLRPRHLRLHDLFAGGEADGGAPPADAVTGRRMILSNPDVQISYVVAGAASPLYRNAIGDECVYVESGAATVETMLGRLDVGPGDYVIMPRTITHRWLPAGAPLRLYCIETASHVGPPKRYLSPRGELLEHAPYYDRDLRGPTFEPPADAGAGADTDATEVYIKHGGSAGPLGTVHVYAHHPFDLVGWDGCVYPYAFNISQFQPLTGRIHQPPPIHQVFEAQGLVICNFVPRKVDYHPLSIPVPYYHSNVDSDEVLFYCGGNYEARKGSGIGPGSVSLHPSGCPHGPQPGAQERSIGVEFFDELAVMVDTFRPLALGEAALACDDPSYPWSWSASVVPS
jgi:homogentisate 1,2-dioxygenase